MKTIGIVRKIDDLGRLVIPVEMRRRLNAAERDPMEIYVEGNRIIIAKYEPACTFCGNALGLIEYKEKCVCKDCIDEMSLEK